MGLVWLTPNQTYVFLKHSLEYKNMKGTMNMSENTNCFYLSDRYRSKMYKDIVMNEILTFVFYFVFNILFKDHPQYGIIKPFFGGLFAAIAILLIIYGKKRADKMAAIHYTVERKGLSYFDGKKSGMYLWTDFIEVRRNPNLISRIYPYEFVTKDETFTLHRQLDKPDELIPLILEKTGLETDF